MRLLFYILAVLSLLCGILFGALNGDAVSVDLYFVQIDLMLGVALLLAVLLGAILAWLMLSIGVVWPLKRKLAKQRASVPGSSADDVAIGLRLESTST